MDEEEEDDDEVAEDEDLTSPHGSAAPQHGHAAATPPTQETDVIARLLAAAKYADEDPERLDNMRALKNQALADKRQAEHSRDFWHEEANKARSRANGLAAELAETKEALRVDGSRRPLRRYAKEHRGAAWTWPLWIVQLVLEHLVNGVPPTSIPAVIRSHAEATVEPGESVDVPSALFCRRMRAVLRVLVGWIQHSQAASCANGEVCGKRGGDDPVGRQSGAQGAS